MEQLILSLPFYTSYDPADFVISECNFVAFEHIRQKYRPASHLMGVIGSENTGKTHLASVFHSFNPTATQLSPDNFKVNDILSLPAHLFIIDNADTIKDEVAFFHLINMVRQRKGMIFFTANHRPPNGKFVCPI